MRWPGGLLKGLAKVLLILINASLQKSKAQTYRQKHVAAQAGCENGCAGNSDEVLYKVAAVL